MPSMRQARSWGKRRNTQTGVIDAFVLTPVPESGTWAMMLLGLGAIAIRGRLRKSGKSRA